MGCTVREKHIRPHHRRIRSVKPDLEKTPLTDLSLKPLDHHLGIDDGDQIRNSHHNPNFDESGWGYCTEDQLEELLLKNLEFLYNEAISKLLGLGYDEEIALKAILRNGHCYGSSDVLTNVIQNSLAYLSSSNGMNLEEPDAVFMDLRQLEEYSLTGMVCLLQQVRPHLSKGDAMWCLLMSDLHVGRASTMEIPVLPSSSNCGSPVSDTGDNGETVSSNSIGVTPGLCKFHEGWGGFGGGKEFSSTFDTTVVRDIECPKRFNLTPSLKSLLQRNVTMFAAGFRANSKVAVTQSQVCSSSLSTVKSPMETTEKLKLEEPQDSDVVSSVLSSLGNLSLDEKPDSGGAPDQKNEMILNLIHQIRELEEQVKERKDWAHQKAMQAARKLSHDLTELKMLRMEREETQRLKKGKQTLEDSTMKRLSEMENALRKASGRVDRANSAVRKLENENAEIRAEMEASKLSNSESVTTCLEIAKREKRCLKRLLAWEKQKAKLQEEVTEEKRKIGQLQQQLHLIKESQKDTELNMGRAHFWVQVKWRQELNAKELAMTQVNEERRSKEAAEVNGKRNQEALRRKIEIDFQRHKDDIQRLEQELSRLKASTESAKLNTQSNSLSTGKSDTAKIQRESNAKLLDDLNKLQDSSEKEETSGRECLVCLKDEVSVVFLPCGHQVLCANCNEDYGKKSKATCPCCCVHIEQRIRVYGASS